jgi:hypothetical protein
MDLGCQALKPNARVATPLSSDVLIQAAAKVPHGFVISTDEAGATNRKQASGTILQHGVVVNIFLTPLLH